VGPTSMIPIFGLNPPQAAYSPHVAFVIFVRF
jgi:hypothetical protein